MSFNNILIILTILYLVFLIFVIFGFFKTKKLVSLKSGGLKDTSKQQPVSKTNEEKKAFIKTRMSNNDYYLKLSFWATFISGIISLCFSSAILFKFSFVENLKITELIKVITCLTSFSFAGIFAFLIKEFNKMKISIIREYNKIPSF